VPKTFRAEGNSILSKLYPLDDIAFLFADLFNLGFDFLLGIAVVFQQFSAPFAGTCIIRIAFVMST